MPWAGRGALWIDGDLIVRAGDGAAARRLFAARKRLGWRVPEQLGQRLARRDDGAAARFLAQARGWMPPGELARVAIGLGEALRLHAPSRLRRLAARLRDDPDAPVSASAGLTLVEAQLLGAQRARRSALAALRTIDRRSLPAEAAAKAAELEVRLLLRLNKVEAAGRAIDRMIADHPTTAIAYDLLALQRYPDDPEAAIEALATRFEAFGRGAHRSCMLFVELLSAMGRETEARRFLLARLARSSQTPEYYVALANLDLRGDRVLAADRLRRYWRGCGLEIDFRDGAPGLDAAFARALPRADDDAAPLVTVVMTAFNAEAFVATAMRSVLAQNWRRLELLVVDDASPDGTAAAAAAVAASDPRARVIRQPRNAGTYVAKNAAIAQAAGAYVALIDSDDWWHPHHVERHMRLMRKTPRLAVSTSDWVRMEETGRVPPTQEGGYQHLNPASTFFRAEVFRDIGFFDCVRIGADSEFLWRLRRRYGARAERRIPEPLAIGRSHAGSLTQSGVGAYNAHNYSPVRLDYWEAWVAWHREAADDDAALRLPAEPTSPERRPFSAPTEILP